MQSLKHLSRQGLLNRVYTSLWWQNGRARDASGTCLYRGPNGTKCGIGHLIEDENYARPLMEQKGVGTLIRTGQIVPASPSESEAEFLGDVQGAHDYCSDNSEAQPNAFRVELNDRMSNVARRYNLHLVLLDPAVHTHRI